METNLLFKMVGSYSISQTEWIMGENRPREDCRICHNAKYGTILVKTNTPLEEDNYICIECLLEKASLTQQT